MSVIGHSPLAGASGAAGGGEGLYVDDLFSTFLYEASGTTQTIANGIDLAGEGGMVWLKNRSNSFGFTNHAVVDSERIGSYGHESLYPNLTESEFNPTSTSNAVVTSFSSNGFTRGGNANVSNGDNASWTFRKATGFFDVVTYSGTGSAQNISHSLGSVPGMIMIHCRDGAHDWEVYHRATGATKSLHLNKTDAEATDSTVWNNTTPTSSVFTIGTSSNVNQNGHGYVAYIFAHDEQSFGANGNEAIIKCGSYTGNGSSTGPVIDLGFEPQFVILRCLLRSGGHGSGWYLLDSMRGIPTGNRDNTLQAQESNAEDGHSNNPGNAANIDLTPTGFKIVTDANATNESGASYIYMAIRRPHKAPTAGTEVFAPQTTTPETVTWTPGFAPDALLSTKPTGADKYMGARLTGASGIIKVNGTSAELTGTDYFHWDEPTGKIRQTAFQSSSDTGLHYAFKRAPGFFDVVAYTGTGGSRTVNHNLAAIPELVILKRRDTSYFWGVYDAVNGPTKYLKLNSTDGSLTGNFIVNDTAPTSTQITVGDGQQTNGNNGQFIAYLFATLNGISKIGSYTGTGSNINVDCGFTAGARFILIKRTDSAGDWYVWDTVRGIVSGNDPYLLLNSNAAQVTNTDYIDPLNAGFTVTSSAPAALNTNGGTYLFLAIA